MIAVSHVLINHSFAVGMMPLLTSLEWWAYRRSRADWDKLLYKILAVCFIVTTSAGALTGVGIWFSTALVNPYAVGSLLRVFYWAWFSEWLVFVTEVVLILIYYLTWKRMRKPKHIRIGVALSVASWLTMAIITGILGFMMEPGDWLQQQSLLAGFVNLVYIPQLLFRTTLALALAGSLALALSLAFTLRESDLRQQAIRFFSGWTLFWSVPMFIWAVVYYRAVPLGMLTNMPVAFGTQAYAGQFRTFLWIALGLMAVLVLVVIWGIWKPQWSRSAVWVVPMVVFVILTAQFERTRQFIRKPYVIGFYMFSNGIRVDDVPYLVKTGVLANSVWTRQVAVTKQNQVEAGRDVFMVACTRCHTLNGANSIRIKLARLYPGQPKWDPAAIDTYLKNIHGARAHMPPFIGTVEERGALAAYLSTLRDRPDYFGSANLTLGEGR